MNENWKPLNYKEHSLGSYFEYNDDGEIRNIITKKLCTQTGDNVVLNVGGDSIKINRYIMLHGERRKNKKVLHRKKDQVFLSESDFRQIVAEEVERQLKNILEAQRL